MYKDLKLTMTSEVTVEDYENAIGILTKYNLSWEEFAEAVFQAGINGALEQPGKMQTMYVYRTHTGQAHWFDVKVESVLFVEEPETIRFELRHNYKVKVEDGS